MIEYRICWAASSNASFRGKSDWEEANEGETADEVEVALCNTDGLDMALNYSGFEWWIETREAEEDE